MEDWLTDMGRRRRPVSINVYHCLSEDDTLHWVAYTAVCDDGSIWRTLDDLELAVEWERMPDIPQDDKTHAAARPDLLRLPQVVERTGLSRSTIYLRIQKKDFPPPMKLGQGRTAYWLESDIDAWIQDKIDNRPTMENGQ